MEEEMLEEEKMKHALRILTRMRPTCRVSPATTTIPEVSYPTAAYATYPSASMAAAYGLPGVVTAPASASYVATAAYPQALLRAATATAATTFKGAAPGTAPVAVYHGDDGLSSERAMALWRTRVDAMHVKLKQEQTDLAGLDRAQQLTDEQMKELMSYLHGSTDHLNDELDASRRTLLHHILHLHIRRGPMGPVGRPGPPGMNGVDGVAGPRGYPGHAGPRGYPGHQGPRGEQGPPGRPGHDGPRGFDGAQGPPGERGPRGERGLSAGPAPRPLLVQVRGWEGAKASLSVAPGDYIQADSVGPSSHKPSPNCPFSSAYSGLQVSDSGEFRAVYRGECSTSRLKDGEVYGNWVNPKNPSGGGAAMSVAHGGREVSLEALNQRVGRTEAEASGVGPELPRMVEVTSWAGAQHQTIASPGFIALFDRVEAPKRDGRECKHSSTWSGVETNRGGEIRAVVRAACGAEPFGGSGMGMAYGKWVAKGSRDVSEVRWAGKRTIAKFVE